MFFYYRLSFFSTILAFLVVIIGAYTRLTDAGLGCPDWPGCYGQWIVSSSANGENPLINPTKAWTEMTHRYLAGSLGLMILTLTILSIQNRWTQRSIQLPLCLPIALCVLVAFQALLGMWTVTLKLLPVIVMAHLLGGLATLSLLWILTLTVKAIVMQNRRELSHSPFPFRILALFSLIALITQLFLGGWTSANYAALACTKFPFCQSHLSVNTEFRHIREAFRLTAAGPSKIGNPLEANELMIVHMTHRIGALLTAMVLTVFSYCLFFQSNNTRLRMLAAILFGLLAIQLLLGILNVIAHLPLMIAVSHNGVAALLLLVLLTLLYQVNTAPLKNL